MYCKFMQGVTGQNSRFLKAATYLFLLSTRYTDVLRCLHNHLPLRILFYNLFPSLKVHLLMSKVCSDTTQLYNLESEFD